MYLVLTYITLGLYSIAFIAGTVDLVTKKPQLKRFFVLLISAGLVSNLAAIFFRWALAGYSPLSNMYETLVCLAAIFVGIFLYLDTKQSIPLLGVLVTFLAVVIMGSTNFLDRSVHSLVPALQSNWLAVHVLLCLTGYAALTIAFISSVIILIASGKSGQKKDIDASVPEADPSCGGPFIVNQETVRLGFFFLTLGIITGAIWAEQTWGFYWSWDPKESWALITWLIFAVYLHGKRLLNWSPQRLSWVTVAGFGAMLFTYFGVSYILPGLHAYA